MRGRNNLTDEHGNACFEVTERFPLYLKVGITPSNTYFGASQAYGNVYWLVHIEPGERIWDTFGGVYAEVDSAVHEAKIRLSDKHPFEKVYLPIVDEWPVDKLRRVDMAPIPSRVERRPLSSDELATIGAALYGRGIDWVYEADR